jgi:hypothetical protein
MTEAEWQAYEDPTGMLLFINQRRAMRKRVKTRKQKLFAVACCRRLWPLLIDERMRRGVEVFERFVEDQATGEDLQAAKMEMMTIWWDERAEDAAALACSQLFWDKLDDGLAVSASVIRADFEWQQKQFGRSLEPFDGRRPNSAPTEERAQADLLRCIFGNPFRPVVFAPSWRTETAVALAAGIYADRAFDRLPILADALEEAGCDVADILSHCRVPGPHARGCWVVDAVLGKG